MSDAADDRFGKPGFDKPGFERPAYERAGFERVGGLGAMFAVRERVIGALIMRELQTRFGRSNFGFLWMFFEPMILGSFIGGIHLIGARGNYEMHGMPGVSVMFFFIIGYIPFFMFRAMINRATAAIHSNLSLLYHRDVLLFDIVMSRNIIEGLAVSGVLAVMLAVGAWITGQVTQKPLLAVSALVLMFLISNGLSMMIAAAAGVSEITDRVVHPFSYLMMPISGTFFMVEWLPPEWRELALWNPLVSINELMREGQFGDLVIVHHDIPYVLQWILATNFLGLMALRVARPRLHMY